jgi:hypothetical protein
MDIRVVGRTGGGVRGHHRWGDDVETVRRRDFYATAHSRCLRPEVILAPLHCHPSHHDCLHLPPQWYRRVRISLSFCINHFSIILCDLCSVWT